MKYLIVGLGNVGNEYHETRHNIGFMVLDAFAKASNIFFSEERYGSVCTYKLKGRTLILLKPSTFMNLSGNAIRYWMQKEKIAPENLLVIVDDIALNTGTLRLKPQGSNAGHNGLKNIEEILGNNNYPRLRFGIGNNYPQGQQIKYVLGKFLNEEQPIITEKIAIACEIIKSFCLSGIQQTMTLYNNK